VNNVKGGSRKAATSNKIRRFRGLVRTRRIASEIAHVPNAINARIRTDQPKPSWGSSWRNTIGYITPPKSLASCYSDSRIYFTETAPAGCDTIRKCSSLGKILGQYSDRWYEEASTSDADNQSLRKHYLPVTRAKTRHYKTEHDQERTRPDKCLKIACIVGWAG